MGNNFVSIRSFKNHSGKKYTCQPFPSQIREIFVLSRFSKTSQRLLRFPTAYEDFRTLPKPFENDLQPLFVCSTVLLTDQLREELIQPVLAISSHELCKIKRVHKLTNVSKQSGHSESKVPFIIASHHA